MQSEESLRYAGRSTIDAIGLSPGDAVGAFVPLSSVAAFCFGMYLPAMLGGPMVCIETWRPDEALEAMAAHDVRWTMLVPTMALQLSVRPTAQGRLSGLKAMTVGGGPMDAGALGRAEQVLDTKLIRVFGMSECLGHTTTRPDEDAETRLACDGRPFPGTVVRAVGQGGRPLPAGEVGAAQVRGPSMFVGYARDGRARSRRSSRPTASCRPATWCDSTPRGRSRFWAGRSRSSSAVAATSTSTRSRPPSPGFRPWRRSAWCRCPTRCSVSAWPRSWCPPASRSCLADVTDHLEAEGFPKAKWPEFVFVVPDLPQNRVGKLSRPDAVRLATELHGMT